MAQVVTYLMQCVRVLLFDFTQTHVTDTKAHLSDVQQCRS